MLLATAVKVRRDALSDHEHTVDIGSLRTVRLLRRLWPVTESYDGTRMTVRQAGRRALTPLALVTVAILGTDVVFAIDSVPAVYGITGDPYLVFATNAFALLGLRALYFVVEGALGALRHLGHGLAAILAFIGVKLVLHWAHGVWPAVPEVPTLPRSPSSSASWPSPTTSLVAAQREDAAKVAQPGPQPRPPVAACRSTGSAARPGSGRTRDRRVARRLVERDRLGLRRARLEDHRLGPGSAAVASRWASIRRARPRPRAAGATYIRLTSAVRVVPRRLDVVRSRHAPGRDRARRRGSRRRRPRSAARTSRGSSGVSSRRRSGRRTPAGPPRSAAGRPGA